MKGDLRKCDNWMAISLLDLVGKVSARQATVGGRAGLARVPVLVSEGEGKYRYDLQRGS